VFVRQFLLALFILPFVIRHRSFATARPAKHATRAALGVAGFVLYAYAISNAPLAIATALSFTKVLFTVLVAIVFLDERVGWRRWTAVIVGFLGVLVVLRPGAAPIDWALVAALADGLLVAFIVLTLKHLTRTERPETIIFYFGLFSALLMAVPAALTWTWPTAEQWARLVGLSALGTLGQAFVVRAWAIGEASALAPVGYVQLVFAALIGYVLFAEVPDVWTWVGTAVIVGSTLYITLREARLKRRHAAAAQAQPTAAE
jgi:drug/metabolite transporter (DMT)-like permease